MSPVNLRPLKQLVTSEFFYGMFPGISLFSLVVMAQVCFAGTARRPPPLVPQIRVNSTSVIVDAAGKSKKIRVSYFDGKPFVLLSDMAPWTEGHLHWYPMSGRVNLSCRSHEIQFFFGSAKVVLDGHVEHLGAPTIKRKEGLWVSLDFFLTSPFSILSKTHFDWKPNKSTLWVEKVGSLLVPRYTSFPTETRVVVEMTEPLILRYRTRGDRQWTAVFEQAHQVPKGHWVVGDDVIATMELLPHTDGAALVLKLGLLGGKPYVQVDPPPRRALVVHVPRLVKNDATPLSQKRPPPPATTAMASVRQRRIVIDPGHGGKDPGTIGAHGTEEKTMNLLLSQELAEALRKDDDYEVLLTRTDDRFIPLEERSRLANENKADVFISLHCNASLSSRLKGFEVYFLSEKASDPHADAVARLENASLVLEDHVSSAAPEVQGLLRSLAKNANINESSELGVLIDRHVAKRLSQPNLGVKQAAFYVLRGARMPAILIETAFLSNPKEERLLRNRGFRNQLIGAIEAGLLEYDGRKRKAS